MYPLPCNLTVTPYTFLFFYSTTLLPNVSVNIVIAQGMFGGTEYTHHTSHNQ